MNDLYDSCQKYFQIVIANTPELLEIVYKIRYQVLCIEKRLPGFEASLYPDMLEKDDYDDHSSHVLLRFIPTGDYIGTVRLITYNPKQPDKSFPIELYGQFDPNLCDISTLPKDQSGEISRFVILSRFDRRKGERRQVEASSENKCNTVERRANDSDAGARERRSVDRRVTPHLALLLAAGFIRLCAHYKITNWLSVMDPALNRLLGFYGMELNPIGPFIEYHGLRRPYYGNAEAILDRMYRENRDAWEVLTDFGKYDPTVNCSKGHK